MLSINLDLDSVCYPFGPVARQWFIEGEGYPEEQITPCQTWRMWEEWGISEPVFWKGIANGIRSGYIFWEGEPTEGARDILGQLISEDYIIHIVTARSIPGAILEARNATFKWLETKFKLPWSSVIISSNKAVLQSDILIDDSPINCSAVVDFGILPICFDQPWNQHWDGLRVSNFEDAYSLIQAIAKEYSNATPDTRSLHVARTSTAEPASPPPGREPGSA